MLRETDDTYYYIFNHLTSVDIWLCPVFVKSCFIHSWREMKGYHVIVQIWGGSNINSNLLPTRLALISSPPYVPLNEFYGLKCLIHIPHCHMIAELHHSVDDLGVTVLQASKVPQGHLSYGARGERGLLDRRRVL